MANSISRKLANIIPENSKYERIWIIAKTDFKLRNADTLLGFFWTIITPLVKLLIYYFVFSMIFTKKLPNYGLHIFSGLIIWMFFLEATKKGIMVLKSKRYLIENIQLNAIDLYLSSILTSLMVFSINLMVYLIVSLFFSTGINWSVLLVPLQIINICILVFGIMLILSTINIFFRDISKFWDMFLLALFWINPIFYAKSLIFEHFPILMYLNPLAGIIINTRNGLLYGIMPDWGIVAYDFLYALVILGIGLIVFKKYFSKAAEKL